jgi:hypothetical protein
MHTGLARICWRTDSGTRMDLAFVLLSNAELPTGRDVAEAFDSIALEGQRVDFRQADQKSAAGDVLEFNVTPCGKVFVGLLPTPVPRGEADEAARFSISSMGTRWTLPPHAAHLLVTMPASDSTSRATTLSCFTSLLAAVSKASRAVGVYWGNAGATHNPAFFISAAQDPALASRLMLWTGVSIAREADGRLSLLSLGMQQLDLPDLLLVAARSTGSNDALATFFDLLAYVVQREKPIPEGDTVGRNAEERLSVRYVPSPLEPSKKVWRVELK